MKSVQKFILYILFITLGVGGAAWLKHTTTSTEPAVKVYASFYPLAFLTSQIAGNKVEVINLTPQGVEPHEFEPSPKDLGSLTNAAGFVFNGAGIDPWAEKIKTDLERRGVKTVQAASLVSLLSTNAGKDPHFWLDPTRAQYVAEGVLGMLVSIQPENEQFFRENAIKLTEQLKALDGNYASALNTCSNRTVVSSHNAFAYLADKYAFEVISIAGLSPDEEPSLKTMETLVDLSKQKNIKYIFYESLVSPKLSETLASSVGAKTLVFDPIEGISSDVSSKTDYFSVMYQNLNNLKLAMQCNPL